MSKNHANIHNGKSLIQLFTSIKYNCMPNNWISIDRKIEKRPPIKVHCGRQVVETSTRTIYYNNAEIKVTHYDHQKTERTVHIKY